MNAPQQYGELFSIRSEEIVIGSVLLDHTTMTLIPYLLPEHFYSEKHQKVWGVLLDLHHERAPFDFEIVWDALTQVGLGETVGGKEGLEGMYEAIHTPNYLSRFAKQVYSKFKLRALVAANEKIIKSAQQPKVNLMVLREMQEEAANALVPLHHRNTLDTPSLASRVIEQVRETHRTGVAPLLPVSLFSLREHIHGWERKKCTVLGALSSVGKTSKAIEESVHLAKMGYNVAFVSVEIDGEGLISRFLAYIGEIDETQIARGFEAHDVPRAGQPNKYPYRRYSMDELELTLAQVEEAWGELSKYIHIVACDSESDPPQEPDFSPTGIIARLEQIHADTPLDFIVIDHLYVLHYKHKTDAFASSAEYGDTVMAFRNMARRMGAHVLMLHQLDPQRAHAMKQPNASTFPGSQRIWQNTDNMLALYAPYMHDTRATDRKERAINVIKARRGVTGTIEGIRFEGAISAFHDGKQVEEPTDNFDF